MEDTATTTPPVTAGPVRRGQGVWLGAVGAATLVLVGLCAVEAGRPERLFENIATMAAIPGILALSQLLLLRSGRIEPATIGVAGLGAAVIGVNSTGGSNGTMLFGVLLALLAAVPFAFLSGFLSLNARTGHALFSAVAVLIGADQLVTDIAPPQMEPIRASILTSLAYNDLRIPGVALVAAALFLATAWYLPRQEARLGAREPSWARVTVLLFLPAFLLAALVGLLYTARIGATVPGELGKEFMIACLLALTAGGCSLKSGEGTVLDVAVGSLFAGSLQTLFSLKSLDSSLQSTILCVVAVVFILIDLARLRTPVPAEAGGDRRGAGPAAEPVNGLP
ncbi:hypothetical protein GCM10010275_32960 [Streptomyces litmocidini]|uniref:hypothetical protein n=1 Tax=Streptomyces litmocidini TaxID=67318 RepID=UPI00167CBE4D|nr:hypothetical protein [Streptomyces litmocidini]GGU93102.1 hypothetical protein GCM10010275_32960 [Streptomyces litmocidini]